MKGPTNPVTGSEKPQKVIDAEVVATADLDAKEKAEADMADAERLEMQAA